LAISVTKNGRPFAERAKEILTSLGAHVLGVVVNGLGGQAGGRYGYGYDSYNYGYGYGYTYRYSYTYTDGYTEDKASSYYSAPANAEMPPHPPSTAAMATDALTDPVVVAPAAPAAPPSAAVMLPPPISPFDDESYPAS